MTNTKHGLSKFDRYIYASADATDQFVELPQNFGRLGPKNPITGSGFNSQRVIDAFSEALDSMQDDQDRTSSVEAGQTFFGQFIDHDITLDATSAIGTRIDPRSIRNIRTPALELDNVYGDGPEASPHLYSQNHAGYLLFGSAHNPLDLPRNCDETALIGDPRNDENQIVSQVHGAFIALHNIVVSRIENAQTSHLMQCAFEGVRSDVSESEMPEKEKPFEAARRLVRLHYQWLVLHDFLPAFVDAHVLKDVLHGFLHGLPPKPFTHTSPLVPVEFSVAAFRFGHATVQNVYTFQEGRRLGLFDAGFLGSGKRDPVHNIDFKHLFDFGDGTAFDTARPIGRKMAGSIFHLPFVSEAIRFDNAVVPLEDAQKLPHRNVFRDRFSLLVASGQQMARRMGVEELAAPPELQAKGITKTPLWYYCLQEAEQFGGKLGPVGGTIVAGVLIRMLLLDPESILNNPGFEPLPEFFGGGPFTLGHMIKCVEENRDEAHQNKALLCPR